MQILFLVTSLCCRCEIAVWAGWGGGAAGGSIILVAADQATEQWTTLRLLAVIEKYMQASEVDLDVKPLDGNLSLLAHAPGSPNGLLLQGWVQCRLQNENIVGRGEVDAHTATTHGQQENCRGRVLLESLNSLYIDMSQICHRCLRCCGTIMVG